MHRFLVACLFAPLLVMPSVLTSAAYAQADAIPVQVSEAFFRYEGRVFRATLSITTYTPGILPEGVTNADSTYVSVSVQSADGQPVPASLQSAALILNTRRRGLRLSLNPSPVAIQVVGYAALSGNFASAIPAGQRLSPRLEFQTPRGRVSLNFNTVVVGFAAPNV